MLLISAIVAGLLAGASSALAVEQRATAPKPVFAHYMIGEITNAHTRQDIIDAKALGIDGFAMNFNQFAYWSNDTVDRLFNNADELGFGLFFSFDHNPGYFVDPKEYAVYCKKYITRTSYFKFNNKPVVSTFAGENVYTWADFKKTVGDVLVIPGYKQANPSTVFSDHQNIDGVFNWNSWPDTSAGKVVVPTNDDNTFQTKAKAASKLFMMGISPLQFKHLDNGDNWYRRGEDNLEYRLGQVLEMQPDMLQFQSWNDAGESHYMGNIWDEPMTLATDIQAMVKDRDHKGYWQIIPAFIKAWKNGDRTTKNMVPTNGKPVQGAFWHHTLTVDANCGSDYKSPDIKKAAEDAVSGILLVAKGQTNLIAVVNIGTQKLNQQPLVEGYNKFKFTGLTPGKVQLEVWDGSTMVGGGYGKIEVTNSASLCNYNFQVVAVPS
ncbi:glycoside hydrolase [Boeremia exigua]|uniref:glycoside hydrolase n=1 Tax=Boeremia exigua TaxID=749465 RepID=UPI001E8EBFE5|nr:glycoside hydrolase [Boeremia exigua]KAH6639603.1 glycoside hydrolase [Boeremia exigua]